MIRSPVWTTEEQRKEEKKRRVGIKNGTMGKQIIENEQKIDKLNKKVNELGETVNNIEKQIGTSTSDGLMLSSLDPLGPSKTTNENSNSVYWNMGGKRKSRKSRRRKGKKSRKSRRRKGKKGGKSRRRKGKKSKKSRKSRKKKDKTMVDAFNTFDASSD